MSLSIGNIGASSISTTYATTTPYNYSIGNQSQTSDAYVESIEKLNNISVEGAAPVQYATGSVSDNTISHIQAAQKAERGFNAVAGGFGESTTSYGMDMMASGYGMVGSRIDLFA